MADSKVAKKPSHVSENTLYRNRDKGVTRKFKMPRRRRQRERQKTMATTPHAFFVHFLAVTVRLQRKKASYQVLGGT